MSAEAIPMDTPPDGPGPARPRAGGPRSAARLHATRLRTAPVRVPPYDDEVPTRHLSLVDTDHPRLPFLGVDHLDRPDPARLNRPVGAFEPRPTSRSVLPDPARFGRTLVQTALEVLAGRRAPGQLDALVSPSVQSGLARDRARRAGLSHVTGSRRTPPVVRSVHVCEPADGIAELSVVVRDGTRHRAVAARLEGLDGRWRCVRLQVG